MLARPRAPKGWIARARSGGALCVSGPKIGVYNPWRNEFVWLDAASGVASAAWNLPQQNVTVRPSGTGAPGQRLVPLGVVCDESTAFVGYIDALSRKRQFVRIIGREAKVVSYGATDTLGPGFLGGLVRGRLLAFRSRPEPRISLFRAE